MTNINQILGKLKEIPYTIRNWFIGVILFYISPYENLSIDNPSIKKKPVQKKKENVVYVSKEAKIKKIGIINQIINYYGNKKYIVLTAIIISVIVAIFIISGFGFKYLWLSAYIIIIGTYFALYPGMYHVFQRKRDIIDGFTKFINQYLIQRGNISYNVFVLENKPDEFAEKDFAKELKKMQIKLNTMESYDVTKQFFEDPMNDYPELQKLKTLTLGLISTRDDSIAKALSDYIGHISHSKTVLESKLGFTRFFAYIALAFMFVFQPFLTYQFSTSLNSSTGYLSSINLVPGAVQYFMFLVFGGMSIVLISIGSEFGIYKEGGAIREGGIMIILVFIISYIIFSLSL